MVECFLPMEEVAGSNPVSRSMKKCDVCPFVANPESPIFESEFWVINLAAHDQYYPGRSYVTAKRHVGSLPDLTNEEWADLCAVIKKFETAVRQGLGATMCNWTCLMNNAYQAQPYNPHVHWHVRPRYEKPVSILGETFTDELFGHHYKRSTDRVVPKAVELEVVSKIQSYL